MTLILSLKPEVNAQDKAGFTALMWAATGNHPEIVERLIEHGANVNSRDRNGYSALWLATLRENQDTATYTCGLKALEGTYLRLNAICMQLCR